MKLEIENSLKYYYTDNPFFRENVEIIMTNICANKTQLYITLKLLEKTNDFDKVFMFNKICFLTKGTKCYVIDLLGEIVEKNITDYN